jgi:hypothetical protein
MTKCVLRTRIQPRLATLRVGLRQRWCNMISLIGVVTLVAAAYFIVTDPKRDR